MGTGKHAATLSAGAHGILHGARSYLLQDELGQVSEAHSISAGLDYPGVGPEHSWLRESGLATYETATDDEALAALERLSRTEGIIPALETAHAVAFAIRLAPTLPRTAVLLLNLSGRGDKDMETVATALGVTLRGETPPPAAVPSRARGDA
jgi:tryptophan synthase beta chain